MSKVLSVTNKKGERYDFILDDDVYESLIGVNVNAHKTSGHVYLTRGSTGTPIHREIAKTPDGLYTDHINGDTQDNRRCNLRVCTNSQNQMNKGKNKTLKNKYKGVEKFTDTCWRAQITPNGKRVHIGSFRTEEDAARAYDRKAKLYYGEFARLNFPDEQFVLCGF